LRINTNEGESSEDDNPNIKLKFSFLSAFQYERDLCSSAGKAVSRCR